jgi:DNA-directed RNA polymerase subunit RPC12/RpoP
MATKEKAAAGTCPHCQHTIWTDHPYTWCSKCGEPLPDEIKARLPGVPKPAADRSHGGPLTVLGNAVACPICRHDRFWTRETLVESRGLAFMDLDWASPAATNYICARCGHMLWFMKP